MLGCAQAASSSANHLFGNGAPNIPSAHDTPPKTQTKTSSQPRPLQISSPLINMSRPALTHTKNTKILLSTALSLSFATLGPAASAQPAPSALPPPPEAPPPLPPPAPVSPEPSAQVPSTHAPTPPVSPQLPPGAIALPLPANPPYPYYYPGYPGYPHRYFAVESAEYKAQPGKWYGWQTLILTGLSTFTLVLSPAADGKATVVTLPLGVSGLLLGPPIVHWAHGYLGKGFGSLGLVLGGSVGAYFMTATTVCVSGGCRGEFGGLIAFLIAGPIGAGITALATNIVDAAVLAREEGSSQPYRPTQPTSDPVPKWSLVPKIDITRERTTIGLAGYF